MPITPFEEANDQTSTSVFLSFIASAAALFRMRGCDLSKQVLVAQFPHGNYIERVRIGGWWRYCGLVPIETGIAVDDYRLGHR